MKGKKSKSSGEFQTLVCIRISWTNDSKFEQLSLISELPNQRLSGRGVDIGIFKKTSQVILRLSTIPEGLA